MTKQQHKPAPDSMDDSAPIANGEKREAPAPEEAPSATNETQRIAELEEQTATLKDQLLRAVAETDNVRKRAQRDQEESSKYAITAFARDLVSVLENLKRASASIPPEAREQNPQLKTLAEGVDLTLKELVSVFEKYGIRRIDPLGEKFDHNLHQAVTQIENSAVPPGHVAQVLQAGYVMHDRLLRPAMVGVAKQSDQAAKVDTQA